MTHRLSDFKHSKKEPFLTDFRTKEGVKNLEIIISDILSKHSLIEFIEYYAVDIHLIRLTIEFGRVNDLTATSIAACKNVISLCYAIDEGNKYFMISAD